MRVSKHYFIHTFIHFKNINDTVAHTIIIIELPSFFPIFLCLTWILKFFSLPLSFLHSFVHEYCMSLRLSGVETSSKLQEKNNCSIIKGLSINCDMWLVILGNAWLLCVISGLQNGTCTCCQYSIKWFPLINCNINFTLIALYENCMSFVKLSIKKMVGSVRPKHAAKWQPIPCTTTETEQI